MVLRLGSGYSQGELFILQQDLFPCKGERGGRRTGQKEAQNSKKDLLG